MSYSILDNYNVPDRWVIWYDDEMRAIEAQAHAQHTTKGNFFHLLTKHIKARILLTDGQGSSCVGHLTLHGEPARDHYHQYGEGVLEQLTERGPDETALFLHVDGDAWAETAFANDILRWMWMQGGTCVKTYWIFDYVDIAEIHNPADQADPNPLMSRFGRLAHLLRDSYDTYYDRFPNMSVEHSVAFFSMLQAGTIHTAVETAQTILGQVSQDVQQGGQRDYTWLSNMAVRAFSTQDPGNIASLFHSVQTFLEP